MENSKILKTIKIYPSQLINKLTLEMDKQSNYIKRNKFMTYIYDEQIIKNKYILRCPGLSVGTITVDDNNVITNIRLYSDIAKTFKNDIYNECIDEILNKYIGYKIEICKKEVKHHE